MITTIIWILIIVDIILIFTLPLFLKNTYKRCSSDSYSKKGDESEEDIVLKW